MTILLEGGWTEPSKVNFLEVKKNVPEAKVIICWAFQQMSNTFILVASDAQFGVGGWNGPLQCRVCNYSQ